ncbi:hypothetical protein A2U01_0032484, partial [Trifolium medium]|nr:hypothetical protein [Trifolium medium]
CCYAFAACDAIAYLHHKKQQGQRRVILSPQDLYNNLVFGPNENDEEEEGNDDDDDDDADEDEDGDEDDDEDQDEDEDDDDDDDEDGDGDEDEGHGKYIDETLNWIIVNGCVLEETCPYKFGVVEPPEPLDDRQV